MRCPRKPALVTHLTVNSHLNDTCNQNTMTLRPLSGRNTCLFKGGRACFAQAQRVSAWPPAFSSFFFVYTHTVKKTPTRLASNRRRVLCKYLTSFWNPYADVERAKSEITWHRYNDMPLCRLTRRRARVLLGCLAAVLSCTPGDDKCKLEKKQPARTASITHCFENRLSVCNHALQHWHYNYARGKDSHFTVYVRHV